MSSSSSAHRPSRTRLPYELLAVREGTSPAQLARVCADGDARIAWLITLSGEAWYESGRRRHWLSPGTIVSLEPSKFAATQLRAGPEWSFVVQTFAGPAALEHGRFLERKFGSLQRLPPTHALISRVLQAARQHDDRHHSGLAREELAHDWIAALHRYLQDHHLAAAAIFELRPDDPRLLAFAGRTVKDFAQEMGCSRTFLTRKLSAWWKAPPSDVLRGLRVRQAAALLRDPSLNLTTVAAQSGFQSLSGFFEAFRRSYGATPGEFRRRAKPILRADKAVVPPKPKPVAPQRERPGPTPSFRRFRDEVRTADWDGPYFRLLTCGETDAPYQTAFEIALSAVIRRFAVVITLDGEAIFETRDESIPVSRGVAIAYPIPMNARWRAVPGVKKWRRIWIQFHGELAESVFNRIVAAHGNVQSIPPRSEPVQLAQKIIRWVRSSRNEPPIFWSQHSYRWMLAWEKHLLRAQRPKSGPIHFRDQPASVFNAQTRSFRQYAKYLGYSLSHLSKKLKAQWNGSPGTVLRNARLDQAAEMLRTTTTPVADIAQHCGYRTPSAFICAFARRFKDTPLRYRHRHRF